MSTVKKGLESCTSGLCAVSTLAFCLVFSDSDCLQAHPTHVEIAHDTWIEIDKDKVSIEYSISITAMLLAEEMRSMNTNNDNVVTDEERNAYLTEFAEAARAVLVVKIDEKRTPLARVGRIDVFESENPLYSQSRTFRFEAKLEGLGAGQHTFFFQDASFPSVPGPMNIAVDAGKDVEIVSISEPGATAPAETQPQQFAGLQQQWAYFPTQEERERKAVFRIIGDKTPAQGEASDRPGKREDEKTGKREADTKPLTIEASAESSRRTNRLLDMALKGGDTRASRGPVRRGRGATAAAKKLQSMLETEELSIGFLIVVIGSSIFFGALHALTPGHGKTVVAAYLVGSKGRVWDAVLLGFVVTLTHTSSVIALGLITLFASRYIVPEKIYPFLGCFSGVLIIFMGLWLFVKRLNPAAAHEHSHSHGPFGGHHPSHNSLAHSRFSSHEYSHEKSHKHGDDSREVSGRSRGEISRPSSSTEAGAATLGSLLSLGVAGGVVPCPDALVVLLIAVALHKILFGLLIIVAFSLGLAAVLIAIGVMMVTAKSVISRVTGEGKLLKKLPIISSVLIIILGFVIAAKALIDAGIVIINL